MTTRQLKLIAMVTMFLDHFAALFVHDPYWYLVLRGVGRLSFPLFAFLLVEGCYRSHHLWWYVGRLFVAAILSEWVFNWTLHRGESLFTHHNVLWLFFAFGLVFTLSQWCYAFWGRSGWTHTFVVLFTLGVGCLMAVYPVDYGWKGYVLLVVLAVSRSNVKPHQSFILGILSILVLYPWSLQAFAGFGLVIASWFNGQPGVRGPVWRWVDYLFYPVHLLVLGLFV